MARKKCAFGFSCASMMQSPGLDAENCENRDTCGLLTELSLEDELELIRVRAERQAESERIREIIRVNARQAATLMLMARGCPQSPESLGVNAALNRAIECLEQLRSQLSNYQDVYIAPTDCELHQYNVKRPTGTYHYNKLTAKTAIFEPSIKESKVCVIHLSNDSDARNLEGQAGIARRNKLLAVTRQLNQVNSTLERVLADI